VLFFRNKSVFSTNFADRLTQMGGFLLKFAGVLIFGDIREFACCCRFFPGKSLAEIP
jgi:hypothetical protein